MSIRADLKHDRQRTQGPGHLCQGSVFGNHCHGKQGFDAIAGINLVDFDVRVLALEIGLVCFVAEVD
jgi:hypothetical protein